MRRRGVWIAVAVAVVVLVAGGVWGALQAKQFEALATAGKADAKAGLNSLKANRTPEALASFQRAADEFADARALLGPEWLHGVPWLGHQLAAADDLTTIGHEGSKAGVEAVQLIDAAGAVTGEGRLSALVGIARPRLDSALSSLVVVAQRADGLSADGLLPPLANAATELKGLLSPLQTVLDRSQALLDLERYLLGAQHRFLVVAQNSSELRPTGGFMGTYGLLDVGPDGVTLEKFSDIFGLPRDTLNEPLPAGGQVNSKHFYFRNTNWWMDFPTSATMMLKFWQNMAQPSVDGVIAVDIPFLQALLEVHGPITVPQSKQPITVENAMALLNEVVQYERSGQVSRADRKVAIGALVTALFRWVSDVPAEKAGAVASAVVKSANSKHVQLYVTDPAAQAANVTAGWSGALAPPTGTTDLVAVSNGVIKPSKANIGVTKTLNYTVALAADGSADTSLTLGFTKSPKLYKGLPQQWLANYTRVHRLAGTQLTPGDGFESLVDATGLPTFGHYFRLDPGASTTVQLRSQVPGAVQDGVVETTTSAQSVAGARHYRLLLARQADLVDTDATVTVTVPDGWKVASSYAQFRVSGMALDTSTDGRTVTLRTPLAQDALLDVALVPA